MKTKDRLSSLPQNSTSRIIRKSLGLLAIGAAVISITPNASAVLIGLGASTHDNATGLEWLDLTATQSLSVNQALATTFVTSDGYRHATTAEVTTLFLNAGFLSTNNVNNPANNPAAELLISLMGETLFQGTVNATGRGFATNGAVFYARPNYHKTALGAGAAVVSLQTSNKNLIDSSSGHFLVRTFAAVPDSGSTLLLLCLSAFALIQGRRRIKIGK